MLVICYLVTSVLAFVLLLYSCLELHYFLRLLLAIVLAKFCKKKTHILDEVNVKGEYYKINIYLHFIAHILFTLKRKI